MIRTRAFRPLALGAEDLAPVVQTLASAIHLINHYPADSYFEKSSRLSAG